MTSKITAQVELDFSEFIEQAVEDSNHEGSYGQYRSLEQTIIETATKQVRNQLQIKVDDKVKELLEKQIFDYAQNKIDAFLTNSISEFLSREVTITNSWGEETHKGTLEDMLKKKFEDYWSQEVNDRGEIYASSYNRGTKYTRLEFCIDKQIKENSDKMMKDLMKNVITATEKYVNEAVKNEISTTLADNIGVSKIVNRIATAEIKQIEK